MDDLILAARLFEKEYVGNLERNKGIGNRLLQGGANLVQGLAGRVAQTQPVQGVRQIMGEGQEARYGKGYRATNVPSDRQAANVDRIDPNRISHVPPTTPAATTPATTAPATDASGMAAMRDAQGEIAPQYAPPQEDTNNDGQLTADDTQERVINTEVRQKLADDGSVDSSTTSHTVEDKNANGIKDSEETPAINSPDPTPPTAPAATTPAATAPAPSGPTSAVPPMNTASTTTQNAAGAAQVANAQKLANTGSGGLMANIATMGGAALMGGINRWRGNRKLNALANAQPGAGGATNANMIRADGTEFLDDHWNLQKARMEARERATTEAIRNAYR